MSRRDEYVPVTAQLKARTAKAVLLNAGDSVSRGGWVPRSCLHYNLDKLVQEAALDDVLELQMMEWVAEDRGLV